MKARPIDVTMTDHRIRSRFIPFVLPAWLKKAANDNGELWK